MHGMTGRYCAAALALALSAAASAQPAASPATNESAMGEWTALADLALASPVILRGTVERVRRISGKAAADVPPGEARLLVEVELADVMKTPDILPAKAEWLWQGRLGEDGKAPFRKGDIVLGFLSAPTAGPKPDVLQYRLTASGGQRAWTAERETAVRALLTDAAAGGAVMVTGVSDGFHTQGAVEGISESQFFLGTSVGKPLTLVVNRNGDAAPTVRVATGDVISASARPVVPRTLVWRGLACGLPKTLPAPLATDAGLAADYALALRAIGPCGERGINPTG